MPTIPFTVATVSIIAVLVFLVRPGSCSGQIRLTNGKPAWNVPVYGEFADGERTEEVITDSDGRFQLSWRRLSGLSKLYVQGKPLATNIENGSAEMELVLDYSASK